jgi:Rieske Fe-S protein
MAELSKPTTADRRTLLRTTALGVAAAGVGVTAAACSTQNSVAQGTAATSAEPADPGAASGSGSASSSGSGSGSPVATTSQVPVKGGFINQDVAVVVTQPSAGEYKAFTAVCTHQQCIVGSVSNNVILCPCHGSEYDATTGEVVRGPAPQALAAKTIKVDGSNIMLEA